MSWLDDLEARHAEAFDAVPNWPAHVRGLNARLGATGRFALTESHTAPEFFIGRLPRFRPRSWIAIVSLNPKEMSPANRAWHEAEAWNATNRWRYLTREDVGIWKPADFYYSRWCLPLVRLLATLSDDRALLDDPVQAYFDLVGAFELVPYASHEYAAGTYERLAGDPAVEFSHDVAMTVIRHCPPLAVLANGLDATRSVSRWLPLRAEPVEHRYESVHREGKTLRHWQGVIDLSGTTIPFAGFPFLRKSRTHNADAEIDQLGHAILARA
ncbi:MAG: hypothetical protein EPO65_13890 [Dehalococcoidia bacterium]|nr:MAG: hypothetical protein EPO65_13890 [Dehalococcoidia bacterium]